MRCRREKVAVEMEFRNTSKRRAILAILEKRRAILEKRSKRRAILEKRSIVGTISINNLMSLYKTEGKVLP